MSALKLACGAMALAVSIPLLGCSPTSQQPDAIGRQMANAPAASAPQLGKSYAQIAGGTTPTSYGPLLAQDTLPNGEIAYKHVLAVPASSVKARVFASTTASTDVDNSGTDFKLSYFRVGLDGTVSGFASGLISGQRIKCLSISEQTIKRCNSAKSLSEDIAQMDAAVTTTNGRSYLSWKIANR